MYGLIHTAAKEMCIENYCNDFWRQLCAQNKIQESDFVTGQVYDDEITLAILSSLATEFKMSLEELLKTFGRYWIGYTSKSTYTTIYKLYGKDVLTFISNLDRMHDTLKATLPEAQTPVFEALEKTDTSITVLYDSSREGLEQFVVGLFEGLLDYFRTEGTVSVIDRSDEGITFNVTLS